MTSHKNSGARPGLYLKIGVLVLSVLLVIAGVRLVRGKSPVEQALSEMIEQLGGLSEVEAGHFREVGQVSESGALVQLEQAHARGVDERLEGVFKRLAWIEACAEEGGAHRMPWMSELLGRLKQEEQDHLRAMGKVKEVSAAQVEEGRHQRAMESLLKDLAAQLEKARIEEREHPGSGPACKGL